MASRRLSNGRSPLVNQQRQITSFFSKSSSSSSPITPIRNSSNNPSKASRGASPSPSTPSPLQSKVKKPLLVIGGGAGAAPAPEKKRLVGKEAVGKRIKVYWPLDKSWYEGVVRSFDEGSGKHLVQYDDAEEESLHLAEEKIEWIEQSSRPAKFKRLRRGSAQLVAKMVIEDDEAENLDDEEENGNGSDDSSDEDWGKSSDKKAIEKCEVEEDEDADADAEMEDGEDEERGSARLKGKRDGKGASRKRKNGGGGKLGCDKKAKGSEFKVSVAETKSNAESK